MDTYPHVFFTSPDEWDPSVLDHDPPHLDGLDPSQVPDQPFGDPMFDAYGDFNERIIANLNILLDAPPEDCGSYTSTSIRVHPKSLIGMLYAHSLHGHPHPASTTLSMSPPGMELLHTHRITLKSTLSLAILFSASPDAVKLLQQTPSSLTPLLLMMVQPWPNSSVVMILLSVMPMASNQPDNSSTPSLITSENGEPWIPSSVMEENMRSPSKSLISFIPYSSKIISLNLITNIKIRLKIALDLPSVIPTLPLVVLPAVVYSVWSTFVLYSTTWHLQLFKASAQFKLWKELLQTLVSCFTSHFMILSTTGLILLSLISTCLHHLMKRSVIGLALLTTKVTLSPGGSSLRILKRSSFVLMSEVPSELQQTSVLHHLHGRGPHFPFPSLILNNLTEFRQPLQGQSHLEMPGILVQLGHIQRTAKLVPQIDLKWSPTRILRRY